MTAPAPVLSGVYALICLDTGAGIRFSPAPWPALPKQVQVETRKRRGAWGRNGVVSQQQARELWRQQGQKGTARRASQSNLPLLR